MIKLEKTKLNELLYYIREDHFKNSLILQLIYAYGRNASEIFNLKPEDINLTDNTITFDITTKKIAYPLLPTLTDDLMGYIYDQEIQEEDFIFRRPDEDMPIAIKKLNYYLDRTVDSLNRSIEFNAPKLTSKDFKFLRGQHLFLDGADLHTIHELYSNSNIQSTKKNIEYNKLLELKFPCNNLNTVFQEYTDFNLYYDNRFDETSLFTVTDDKDNIIIEINHEENIINIITNEETGLTKAIEEVDPNILCSELSKLEPGNFKFINSLRFIKN